MIEKPSNKQNLEKVILIGVKTPEMSVMQLDDYLKELAFLAETAGAEPVKFFTQNLPVPDPRTYVGTGKLDVINEYI